MLVQSFLVSSLLLAASVIAQSTSERQNTADSSASGESMVSIQVVRVGDGSLNFEPEEINAEPGTMVQFHFYQNHTLTQSTFDKPCRPIASNGTGINTGPLSPPDPAASPLVLPVFTFMINDTKPLWMYCAIAEHCKKGMSMVINPPATGEKTLAAYKASASSGSSQNGTGITDTTGTNQSAAEPFQASASSVVFSVLPITGLAAVLTVAFALSL